MNFNEIIKSSEVVLVEFYASWCPHCQRMMPVVEAVREKLRNSAKVVQIDIDKIRNSLRNKMWKALNLYSL